MALVARAMAAWISAACETAGEGSGQRIGWDGETVEQLKLALPEVRGLRASWFCLHIVAILLQVIVKIQVISERENRAAFLRSLSLRRKGHPSGGIHAPWYLPSEIAGTGLGLQRYYKIFQHSTSSAVSTTDPYFMEVRPSVLAVWYVYYALRAGPRRLAAEQDPGCNERSP